MIRFNYLNQKHETNSKIRPRRKKGVDKQITSVTLCRRRRSADNQPNPQTSYGFRLHNNQ